MSGWTDLPLTSEGRLQARRLRERIAEGPPVDAFFASTSRRAVDTASILAGERRGTEVCEALREINCGAVDGQPVGEVKRKYPELWATNERQDDPEFRWPGGESYREFRQRCTEAVARIAAEHAGGHVVVVTHAGVIGQIVGAFHGLVPARWSAYRVRNCSVTELLWAADGVSLVRFDDCGLAPLAPAAAPRAPGGHISSSIHPRGERL